jgi:hypothetical protein
MGWLMQPLWMRWKPVARISSVGKIIPDHRHNIPNFGA